MSSLQNLFTEPHTLTKLNKTEPILLGLSGGADSSALLHLLCLYRERVGCEIFAAHLNHGIRTEVYGNEALRDENFCRALCEKLKVRLFVKRLDIPSLAKKSGKSLETEARDARYAFFTEIMRQNNIKILATAHNADDNLETQLCNLSRGCGIDGMAGIPECRHINELEGSMVIRPILKAQKSEILSFCAENSIPYVTDSTNFHDDCTRNVIRNNVIPKLSSLFPALQRSALRLSRSAAEDSDFILGEAKSFLDSCNGEIEVKRLSSLHPALKKRVIMLSFEQKCEARLESVHISDIISALGSDKNGVSVSLPNKKRAEIIDGYLYFCDDKRDNSSTESYNQKLDLGQNRIKNTPFSVFVGKSFPNVNIKNNALYAKAVIKDTGTELYAKNRSPGEHITDGGVNKKIKKLMCDKKVPLQDRDILPIICADGQAIYVPLCAVSDSVKSKAQADTLHIAIYKTKPED